MHQCGFDAASKTFYLFGGQSNEVPFLGDLWQLDPAAQRWNQVSSEGEKPQPRLFSGLAIDQAQQRLLVFGGLTQAGRTNDLWEFRAPSRWSALQAHGPPESRSNHATAFDSRTKTLYVFGGASGSELGDLWRLKL